MYEIYFNKIIFCKCIDTRKIKKRLQLYFANAFKICLNIGNNLISKHQSCLEVQLIVILNFQFL